jgi:hypothetical protein
MTFSRNHPHARETREGSQETLTDIPLSFRAIPFRQPKPIGDIAGDPL